jgi:hypothetical protein
MKLPGSVRAVGRWILAGIVVLSATLGTTRSDDQATALSRFDYNRGPQRVVVS